MLGSTYTALKVIVKEKNYQNFQICNKNYFWVLLFFDRQKYILIF